MIIRFGPTKALIFSYASSSTLYPCQRVSRQSFGLAQLRGLRACFKNGPHFGQNSRPGESDPYVSNDHHSKICMYCPDVYILSSRSVFIYLISTMARCRILQQLLLLLLLLAVGFTIFTISKLLPFLLLLAVAFTMQRKLRHHATSLWTTDNIELFCFLLSESIELFTFVLTNVTICISKSDFGIRAKHPKPFCSFADNSQYYF